MAQIDGDVKRGAIASRSPRALQILDAATTSFFERGYAAVSIDEIGALVGVSGPAIYRHFPGKVAILVALFELTVERLLDYVGPVRETPLDELDALIRGQAKLAARHTALVRVFETEESALPGPRRADIRRRQRQHVKRWIAALRGVYPERRAADLELASYAAIGLILSVPRWPKVVRAHADLEESLVAAVRRSLGLPAMPQL